MRAREFLKEAKGIFGRIPGDAFINQDGKAYKFIAVDAYPPPEQAKFATTQERDESIANFQQQTNSQIEWTNNPTAGSMAWAVAVLDDEDGGHIYWGRYLQQTKHNMLGVWDNKNIPTGWKLATKGAKKLQAGFDPQNLIKTEAIFNNVDQAIQTVSTNITDPAKGIFVENLQHLASGRGAIIFSGMAHQMEAIRDYFGEIMQPVALAGGVIQGQAEEARQLLADGAPWSSCKITWPMSMNAALCDSFMIAPNGQEIGISSKGGSGAKASAKNLYDAYVKAQREGNTDLLNTAKYAIEVVSIIADSSAIEGPFKLGIALKVPNISDQLFTEVVTYIKTGKTTFDDISQEAAMVLRPYTVRPDVVGFNTGYAIMAAVAKTVAAAVNNNPAFGQGALALLNQSSIIQVYTKMANKGEDAVLQGFTAVYPPNFEGIIMMDGGKNYYSSRISGKLAFFFK
jgi:hypothetical protein